MYDAENVEFKFSQLRRHLNSCNHYFVKRKAKQNVEYVQKLNLTLSKF